MSDMRRRFLSVARQRVLHQLVSGWRRRGTSLLQIGLDAGFSPEFFWEAGFDVTAVERSMACLEAARAQTGPRVGYVCSVPGALPFEDGEFDYAVLVHQGVRRRRKGEGASAEELPSELAEALRVASRGIIVLDWNRFSLSGVPDAARSAWDFTEVEDHGELAEIHAGSSCSECVPDVEGVLPWELYSLLRKACPGRRISCCSVLPFWEYTWPDARGGGISAAVRKALTSLNLRPSPLPLGALIGFRVDWTSMPLTPVGMLRKAAATLYPAQPREELAGQRSTLPAALSRRERKEL